MTPSEREVLVARVYSYLHHRNDDEMECAEHLDGPDTCDCGATDAFRALCAEVERLTRERDAERQAREVTVGWYDERRAEVLRLTAEVERLREDAARLDWLEQHAGRVSGPAADSPRFVIWGDTDATDALGDTLRETIDAARTTGGRDA